MSVTTYPVKASAQLDTGLSSWRGELAAGAAALHNLGLFGVGLLVLGTVEFFAILINQVVGVRSQPREIVAEALHEVSGDQE